MLFGFPSLAFVEGIGGPELMMIMFIILLLFGADRLPGLARGFGKSMREFKKAASGVEEEIRQVMAEDERQEIAKKRPPAALPRPESKTEETAPPPPKSFPSHPPPPPSE